MTQPAQKLVLVVDDERVRHERFREIFATVPGAQSHHAFGVAEAIVLLGTWPYAMVCLDHDMGLGPDGRDLCHWLVAHPEDCPGTVLIHSRNPVTAIEMEALIAQDLGVYVRRIPFQPKPRGST